MDKEQFKQLMRKLDGLREVLIYQTTEISNSNSDKIESKNFSVPEYIVNPLEDNFQPIGKSNSRSVLMKLRKVFFKSLEQKTGWGRNQLKTVFDECVIRVLKSKIT